MCDIFHLSPMMSLRNLTIYLLHKYASLHIKLVDQISISLHGPDLLWLCVIIPWSIACEICYVHLIKSYSIGSYFFLHYIIPEIHVQAHGPDGSLVRGPDGRSAAPVTSLGRARLGLG